MLKAKARKTSKKAAKPIPANRTETGTFKSGQSGNPSGRPKENQEVKLLARQHTAEAIARLAYWLKSENAKASVSAAIALLDRAWGKAPQAITGEDGGPIRVAQVVDELHP